MNVKYLEEEAAGARVKGNVVRARGGGAALVAVAALLAAALALAAALDARLPAVPARPSPAAFSAHRAHRLLRNLTAVGPRVAGSYESEVAAVAVLAEALRGVAAGVRAPRRLEWEVWREGGGAFALRFLDNMNHVYRDVACVAARLTSAAPGARAPAALLLNAHFDTVPDSAGASDDGAGCAVLVEAVRALAAAPPAPRDLVLLLNGAEENVLQAAHAFATRHRWARRARALLNVEACGAGGREVVFQAGPRAAAAWLVDAYARHAPHPFASSLAQEVFESGAIPAETDFRVFREHGRLAGLDLAWSARGHVYHTRLDTAERVPLGSLQRAGENVVAVAGALLHDPRLDAPPAKDPLPLYFDVFGAFVVRLGEGACAAAAAAGAAAALASVEAGARDAARALGVPRAAWWRAAARGALVNVLAALAGAGVAGGAGLALHVGGARLAWYARPALAPALFAPLALLAQGATCAWLAPVVAPGVGGEWRGRALTAGGALAAAALAAGSAGAGLRSGVGGAAWAAALAAGGGRRAWPARLLAAAALPAAHAATLALAFLALFLPVAGRAGPAVGPFPPDMVWGGAVGAVSCACAWWAGGVWAAAGRRARARATLALGGAALLAAALLLAAPPYSEDAPQRLMVFHTTRTTHHTPPTPHEQANDTVEHFYWVPELDVNTKRTFYDIFPGGRGVSGAECAAWVYCGVPYYLPVLGLLPASLLAPAPAPAPGPAPGGVRVRVSCAERGGGALHVAVSARRSPPHAVLILRLARPATLTRVLGYEFTPVEAVSHGGDNTYFISVFNGVARSWNVTLEAQWGEAGVPGAGSRGQLSAAGHFTSGPRKLSPALAALLPALPPWIAASAWTVEQHLYTL